MLLVVEISPFVFFVVTFEDVFPCPVPVEALLVMVADVDEDRPSSRFGRVNSVFCCLFSLFVAMGAPLGPITFVAMLTR